MSAIEARVIVFVVMVAYLMPASVTYASDVVFFSSSLLLMLLAGWRLRLNPGLGVFSILFIYVCLFHIFLNDQLHALAGGGGATWQAIKTALYGIFNLSVIICIYNAARRSGFSGFLLVSQAIFHAGIALSVINLSVWLIETGATLSRYNYLPPIAGSHGVTLTLLVISLLTSLVLKEQKAASGFLVPVGQLLILVCMITILVREVWALFFVSILASIFMSSYRRLTLGRVFLLSLISFVALVGGYFLSVSALMSDIAGATASDDGSSTTVRVLMVERALALISEHIWFGVGYGSYPLYVQYEVTSSGGMVEQVSSPHNGFILILAELGILGLLLWFATCLRLSTALLRSGPTDYAGSLPIRIFLVLLVFDQLISNSLFIPPATERNVFPVTVVLWAVLGFLVRRVDESPRNSFVVS